MNSDEKGRVIKRGIQYRARKRFLAGIFGNPYGRKFDLETAMAEMYDDEITRLKHERICPACGQTTFADIDF